MSQTLASSVRVQGQGMADPEPGAGFLVQCSMVDSCTLTGTNPIHEHRALLNLVTS
jgi:hypothetical protein